MAASMFSASELPNLFSHFACCGRDHPLIRNACLGVKHPVCQARPRTARRGVKLMKSSITMLP